VVVHVLCTDVTREKGENVDRSRAPIIDVPFSSHVYCTKRESEQREKEGEKEKERRERGKEKEKEKEKESRREERENLLCGFCFVS
jgi:hypothetical protein